MFAYIPARGGSKRIPRKNVKKLGDKPLIAHVIGNLLKASAINKIAVSSDDDEVLQIASSFESRVATLKPRASDLCDDHSTFLDLVKLDLPRYVEHFGDNDVILVLPTAALISSTIFNKAIELFQRDTNGLVCSVTSLGRDPMLAMVGDPASSLTPLFTEMYVKPTKDLPVTYIDAGCFYCFDFNKMKSLNRFMDLAPIRGFLLDPDVGIDVDTPEDWSRLEQSFTSRKQ